MIKMPPDETDAEQRHRLWWGVRRAGPVQWVSICIVLAMVAALFWLAIYFPGPPAFDDRATIAKIAKRAKVAA